LNLGTLITLFKFNVLTSY